MNRYVGLAYAEHPCWRLCQLWFHNERGITLPHIGTERLVNVSVVDQPVDGCLVRVVRHAPLAEHWGVYVNGHVLHAQHPSSVLVPVHRFLAQHPNVQFFQVHRS